MSARISLMTTVWFAALLGCSTASAPSPKVAAHPAPLTLTGAVTLSTQPTYQSAPQSDSKQGLPRFCRLGTTCLSMDPRPFELCYLSDKSCGDKLAETLLVDRSRVITKPKKLP